MYRMEVDAREDQLQCFCENQPDMLQSHSVADSRYDFMHVSVRRSSKYSLQGLLLLSQPQTLHRTSLYLTLALPLPLNYKSALTSMPFFERAEYINISGGTFIEISGDELGHYQLAFINGFPDY